MARGRFLSRDVSTSTKLADLSTDSHRMLWAFLQPWLDRDGRLDGRSRVIRAQVIPLLGWTDEMVDSAIADMVKHRLVIAYTDQESQAVIESWKFAHHQPGMRYDREAESRFGPPPDGAWDINDPGNPDTLQPTPDQVQPTPLQVQVQVQDQVEEVATSAADNSGSQTPLQLSAPEPPKRKRKSRKRDSGETTMEIGWRIWRAAWSEAYGGATYVQNGADGKAMKALAVAVDQQVKAVRPNAGPDQAREGAERLWTHWATAYLSDEGSRGFLTQNKHPLRCMDRELAKYGLPWGPRAVASRSSGNDRPESRRIG